MKGFFSGFKGYRAPLCALLAWGLLQAAGLRAGLAQEAANGGISDPAIKVLLDSAPTTPLPIARLINTLIDLRQPAAAQGLLQKLIDLQLSDDQLAMIHAELGSAFFAKLARQTALGPAARDFADQSLAAIHARARDPQRIADWIEKLGSERAAERLAAAQQLQLGGDAAILALCVALADEGQMPQHRGIQAALVGLGPEAFEPLLALVSQADDSTRLRAVEVLARLDHPDTVLYAIPVAYGESSSPMLQAAVRAAVPQLNDLSRGAAAARLYQQALDFDAGRRSMAVDSAGEAVIWSWDDGANQLSQQRVNARLANARQAVRYASLARSLEPGDRLLRRFYLTVLAELHSLDPDAEVPSGGEANPWGAISTADLEDLLRESLRGGRTAAAIFALRSIAGRDSLESLHESAPQPSIVVQALRAPQREVRFAAWETLARLDPRESFPGASYVAEAIRDFLATRGARRALIADPNPHSAPVRAAVLSSLGYEVEWAGDVRETIRRATGSADIELILLDERLLDASGGSLLASLRRDARTAQTPLVVMTRTADSRRSLSLVTGDGRRAVWTPSGDGADRETLAALVAPLTADRATAVDRLEQARAVVGWLATLDDPTRVRYGFRALEPALVELAGQPEFSEAVIPLLAALGTPGGQTALVGLANGRDVPEGLGTLAAEGFAWSVSRHGVLLTRGQLEAQYERYNASETESAATQTRLGHILDTLEGKVRSAESESAPTTDAKEEARE